MVDGGQNGSNASEGYLYCLIDDYALIENAIKYLYQITFRDVTGQIHLNLQMPVSKG